MHALSLPDITTYSLCILFGIVGALQFSGIGFVRRSYGRWGYPSHVFRIIGVLQLLAAGFLATSSARPLGVAIAALVNFISVVVLLKNRAYLLALPGLAVNAVLPLAFMAAH